MPPRRPPLTLPPTLTLTQVVFWYRRRLVARVVRRLSSLDLADSKYLLDLADETRPSGRDRHLRDRHLRDRHLRDRDLVGGAGARTRRAMPRSFSQECLHERRASPACMHERSLVEVCMHERPYARIGSRRSASTGSLEQQAEQ